ncbi:MAG TPA: putative metal-dependent hydrolase [Ignavibacteriales bacterium]|nr:putative metal-dependent hydrolase [Ignavibacteriales bacterium]
MQKDPRYPIGRFDRNINITREMRSDFIKTIETLPSQLKKEVENLSPQQLDTPYRDGGWTIRQVVHHIPDSHVNSYVRFKLALTEDNPQIKTYEEHLWAELPDTFNTPIEISLQLLDSVHKRWAILLRSLTDEQFEKTFQHPEWGNITLRKTLALYAWHSKHHLAHITELKKKMGW